MVDDQNGLAVRQVTNVHSNWSAQGEGTDGKFSFQLILDDGAQEAIIRPVAEDSFVVLQLLALTSTVFFDTVNRVLIFGRVEFTPPAARS
ncbi:MAG: hypothetical protein ABW212_08060 [Pseudonocardia sediminis]